MNRFIQRVIPVVVLCGAPLASAVAAAADPTQTVPSASLPNYRSAFADYKPFREDKPGDWRALNDAVEGAEMSGMSSMGEAPHHAMPMAMPMSKERASAGLTKPRAPSAAASMPVVKGMPGMRGMPGMPGHADPATPGSKP